MLIDIKTIPTALQPAFVAPTFGGSAAGVCLQAAFRRADRTQGNLAIVGDAGMATGHRSWSPLIT
jgi:hypothetical protein